MKLLTLILSAKSGPYPRLTDAVFSTWAGKKYENQEIYVYYGGYEKEEIVGNELHLTCPDSDITAKSLAAMQFALKNLEFDYMLKTSVSMYIRLEKLYDYLLGAKREGFYGGDINKIPLSGQAEIFFKTNLVTYPSGVNQIFSRDLIENIVTNQDKIVDAGYGEDFHIGLYLQRLGMKPSDSLPYLKLLDYNLSYMLGTPRSVLDKYIFYRCKTEFKDFLNITGNPTKLNPALRNDDDKIKYLHTLYS